jgi:hypothetical protein
MKLLTEYESATQKVLFGNAVLAALMSGRIYDVIIQNGDLVFRNIVSFLKGNVVTELSMEKLHLFRCCYPTLVKAISRDW